MKYFFLLIAFFLSVRSGELLSCNKGKKFVFKSFKSNRGFCPYCKWEYSESHLRKHKKTCDRNPNKRVIRCESALTFVSEHTLKCHKETTCPLGEKKKWKCAICNRYYVTKRYLEKHKKSKKHKNNEKRIKKTNKMKSLKSPLGGALIKDIKIRQQLENNILQAPKNKEDPLGFMSELRQSVDPLGFMPVLRQIMNETRSLK